jgi:hypothetical protein
MQVIFSIYHYYLARRVAGSSPDGQGDPDEIQVAYIRLLKAGLTSLPEGVETLLVDIPASPAETILPLERHDPRAIDFRHFLRTWFCKVPWSSIKLLEIQKWLYWALFNAVLPPLEHLPDERRSALDDALGLLERRLGCKIEEGSNPNVVPMRLTTDRVTILWRPFTFYALVGSINWGLRKVYTSMWNVQHGYSNSIE